MVVINERFINVISNTLYMLKYNFEKDVQEVVRSLRCSLEKESRRDPTITIGVALDELLDDLDLALVGANREHASQRIRVMQKAIDMLGLYSIKEQKVSEYLLQNYS